MRNEPLRDALRRLPAETASEAFTTRVLARLDDARPRIWILRLAPVAAMLVLAAVALPTAWHFMKDDTAPAAGVERASQRARVLEQLAALQADRKRLDREWRQYRTLAQGVEPVLYLGGNEKVDVLLDLRRVPPESLRGDVVPAALTERSYQP
ncbi:MAG: hypothetical protein O7C74_02085 [Acidobacteria bacterium]|nr:hypothetical protein [Acidobacteriota bacterium]